MPAVMHRVYICPEGDQEATRVIALPVWWDAGELFREYQGRVVERVGLSYVDYGLTLSCVEALEWNRRFREEFASDPRSGQVYIRDGQKEFEDAVLKAKWVIVEAYEWESGFD